MVWYTQDGLILFVEALTNGLISCLLAYGQAWWDLNTEMDPNGTGLEHRPHLARFDLQNGLIKGWKVRKPIAWYVLFFCRHDNYIISSSTFP